MTIHPKRNSVWLFFKRFNRSLKKNQNVWSKDQVTAQNIYIFTKQTSSGRQKPDECDGDVGENTSEVLRSKTPRRTAVWLEPSTVELFRLKSQCHHELQITS